MSTHSSAAQFPKTSICDGINTLYMKRYAESAFLYRYSIEVACPSTEERMNNRYVKGWRRSGVYKPPLFFVLHFVNKLGPLRYPKS